MKNGSRNGSRNGNGRASPMQVSLAMAAVAHKVALTDAARHVRNFMDALEWEIGRGAVAEGEKIEVMVARVMGGLRRMDEACAACRRELEQAGAKAPEDGPARGGPVPVGAKGLNK